MRREESSRPVGPLQSRQSAALHLEDIVTAHVTSIHQFRLTCPSSWQKNKKETLLGVERHTECISI